MEVLVCRLGLTDRITTSNAAGVIAGRRASFGGAKRFVNIADVILRRLTSTIAVDNALTQYKIYQEIPIHIYLMGGAEMGPQMYQQKST